MNSAILHRLVSEGADVYSFSCYIWNIDFILGVCEELKKLIEENVNDGEKIQMQKNNVIIIEGIHGLNDRLSYELPKDFPVRIVELKTNLTGAGTNSTTVGAGSIATTTSLFSMSGAVLFTLE